jgi:hypothetical protein
MVGVTTAHSLAGLGQAGAGPQQVGFGGDGATEPIIVAYQYYGAPGQAFSGDDLSTDVVLLQFNGYPDANEANAPDPRGSPQPGERVVLYCGQCVAPFTRLGTVMSSAHTADWVLMDETFDPNGMSGSPVLSAYTGRVVGMAVAATHKQGRLLIGLNPIGAIVARGLAATTFPPIAGFAK